MSNEHTTPASAFRNASSENPCPICNHTDWCWTKTNRGGEIALVGCRRHGDDVRRDKSGTEYYLHKLAEDDGGAIQGAVPERRHSHNAAGADALHEAYTIFLGALHLSGYHRQALRERGLHDDDIERAGYRSWPERLDPKTAAVNAVVEHLKQRHGDAWKDALHRIPGFYVRELRDTGEIRITNEIEAARHRGDQQLVEQLLKRLRIAQVMEGDLVGEVPDIGGQPGVLIPVRDLEGRIVALQLRLDDVVAKGKYRPFTSRVFRGSSPGMLPHVPLRDRAHSMARVRAVEGVFKADITTIRTGELCLSFACASAWAQVIPLLKTIGAKTVVLPFDADVRTNKAVAGAMARFACQLVTDGFEIEVETWDPKLGKGIDDVIAAGHRDQIATPKARPMWEAIQDFLVTSTAPKNPDVAVNLALSDVIEKVRAESSYAFTSEVLSAASRLGEGPRYQRLIEALKGAGVGVTDWKKAVAKRRALLDRKQQVAQAKAKGRPVFARGYDAELAVALLDHLADKDRHGRPFHDTLVFTEGLLHAYTPNLHVWQPVGEREQSLVIQGFAGSIVGEKTVLMVNEPRERGSIRLAHRRVHQPEFFEGAPAGVMFTNGFAEVTAEGVRLRSGLPSDRARHRFEFEYRPNVPQRLLDFFEAVFRDDADKAERITFIQEFLGACFLGIAPKFQKVLVLYGDGNNGKSKFAEIIERCFPEGSVCGITPHRRRDDYHVAGLAGKRLNLCGELPARELTDSEIVKLVVTAEHRVRARSPYKEPFEFFAIAGHVFLANKLPATSDQTDGFWRRFIVLPFTRVFMPGEEDPGIVEKVLQDRPAIVAWIIDGAVRILQHGRFTAIPESTTKAKLEWQLDADVVRRFLATATMDTDNTTEMLSLESLYNEWKPWAEGKGHRNMAENTLGSRVKQIMQGWARTADARLAGLSDTQRASVLREGTVHTKKGNRYPVKMLTKHDDISADELAAIIDLDEARARVKAGEGG